MALKPVVIIGSGGHAKVVCDALLCSALSPLYLTDMDESRWGQSVLGVTVKGSDGLIEGLDPSEVELANGLASTKTTSLRRKIFETWTAKGYSFATVRHPSSIVAHGVSMGQGVQIFAGAVIQAGAVIGDNVIINTGAVVEHDCRIGAHCHIAPNSTMSGFSVVEVGVHFGTSATLIQGIRVGSNSTIAAGAVVVADVPPNSLVKGVPGTATPNNLDNPVRG